MARGTGKTPTGGALERFREDLQAAGDDELRLLFSLRPEAFVTGAENLRQVAAVLVEPVSVAAFYEMADLAAQQVMQVLALSDADTTVAELAEALGGAEADVEAVASRLAAAWIVRPSGRRLQVNPGLASALTHPCGLGPPAAQAFGARPNSELASIVVRHGKPGGGAKAELLNRISRVLADRDHLGELIRRAPAGTERLLRTACEWPELRLSAPTAFAARRDDTPVGWCLRRGLLAPTGYVTAVLVREAALALRSGRLIEGFAPHPPALPSRPLDQHALDAGLAETALRLVADVAILCEEWGASPAKLLRAGGLGVREVRRVAKATGRSESEAARLAQLAWAAGLVGTGAEEAAPTAAYDAWKARDHAGRWADLAEAWLRWPDHLSFAGMVVGGDTKPAPPLLDEAPEPAALSQRTVLLQLMSTLPAGQAADPGSLLAAARWVRPAEWSSDSEHSEYLAIYAGWVMAEAEMLGVAGGGAMSSAGRMLIEGRRGDAETAMRPYFPAVVEEMILQADLTATVAGQPSAALAEELGLLADIESSGAATVWRFSESSLRRGFEAGRDAAGIASFLASHSTVGVPQPLSYLVEDVGRRYGRLRVGACSSYLRCDEPSLLAEITRSKRAARLGLRLLAPTVAVSDRPPAELADGLRAGGWLPAAENPDGTLVVARPVGRRVSGDDTGDEDFDADGFDLDDLLDDPDLLGALGGMPAALAGMLVAAPSGALPSGPQEIEDLIDRLRRAPDVIPPAPPAGRQVEPPPPAGPPALRLFEGSERPQAIVKDPRHIRGALEQAEAEDWAVRMSYVNAAGTENEFYAEILSCGRGSVNVRYLGDRRGGAELQMYRIQWVRVLTDAEEEMLYG